MPLSTSPDPYGHEFSKNFNQHLTVYCIAAAAAGVSLLALAQPAEGKVVITNKTIPIDGGLSLDLNNDGVPDIEFSFFKTYAHYTGLAAVTAFPTEPGGAIVAKGGYASALLRSAKIGPSDHFSGGVYKSSIRGVGIEGDSCLYSKCNTWGKWGGNHPNRFLGLKFVVNGKIHYGWIRITITITSSDLLEATVTEYGYETIANKRLLAGVPSNQAEVGRSTTGRNPSLGMLALGADGLTLWRREEAQP